MSEQQDNPGRRIVVPVLLVVVACAAFGYAVYAFDGVSLVMDLLDRTTRSEAVERDPAVETPQEAVLELPEGMTEEFALRLWQEQIDSQANIAKLATGDVGRLVINEVSRSGDEAILRITAEFTDGSSADGQLGMRRIGENWFFSYVSGMRAEDTGGMADDVSESEGGPPTTELPSLDDVDVPLLNTIIEQQVASAATLDEYASGAVFDVRIVDVVNGTGTTTLKLGMNEDHEQGTGEVVMISKPVDGEDTWFIARFTKTDEAQ